MQGFVTYDMAEDLMIEAWDYLLRSPDRERGFQTSGSRSGWPEIVREVWEYADTDARPRMQLDKHQSDVLARMYVDKPCIADAILPQHRRLVGLVLTMRLSADRVDWCRVFDLMGGKRSGKTSEAYQEAYRRQRGRVTVALDRSTWACSYLRLNA